MAVCHPFGLDRPSWAIAPFYRSVIEALRQTETALWAYARQIDRRQALRQTGAEAASRVDQANRLDRFGRSDCINLLTSPATLGDAEGGRRMGMAMAFLYPCRAMS